MSKLTWVGFGGSRWRGQILAVAVVGLAAAGLIVASGLTGGLSVAPGAVVEAAQRPAANGGASRWSRSPLGGRCMRGSVESAMGQA